MTATRYQTGTSCASCQAKVPLQKCHLELLKSKHSGANKRGEFLAKGYGFKRKISTPKKDPSLRSSPMN